jgi:hypothetical protein
MIGVDAGRVPAGTLETPIARQRAPRELVGVLVRRPALEAPVAIGIRSALPLPAGLSVVDVHVLPEATPSLVAGEQESQIRHVRTSQSRESSIRPPYLAEAL